MMKADYQKNAKPDPTITYGKGYANSQSEKIAMILLDLLKSCAKQDFYSLYFSESNI
jgi:hypothetical protein